MTKKEIFKTHTYYNIIFNRQKIANTASGALRLLASADRSAVHQQDANNPTPPAGALPELDHPEAKLQLMAREEISRYDPAIN
ncbi:unnamed protein product [Pieris macdunnoughi]|uniref:Uncharacterized protein n=1 Tax=Pieris macdunnoughi TaxID=345717 RepID=A0A821RMQ4_9NEOP|nr:unnamed protein product [Pieris macdunnoughi]